MLEDMEECCVRLARQSACACACVPTSPYLHLGLKFSVALGFFSFRIIMSWRSRRKASRPIWFRKVLSSLAFSGLRSALYLESISPNGSWNERRTSDTWKPGKGKCDSLGPGGQGEARLTFSCRSISSDLWAERIRQSATMCFNWHLLKACKRAELLIGGPVFIRPCTNSTSLTVEATSVSCSLLHLQDVSESPLPLVASQGQPVARSLHAHLGRLVVLRSVHSKYISVSPVNVFCLHCRLAGWGGILASPLFQGLHILVPLWGGIPVGSGEMIEGQCWFPLEEARHETHLWNQWGRIAHLQHVLDIHI